MGTGDAKARKWSFSKFAIGPSLALLAYWSLTCTVDAAGAVPSQRMRATLAVMIWMAAWWLTEATAIATTALLPLIVFPLFGIRTVREAAAEYAHPMIFLFLGGFLIALTMQRWRLDRRLALMTLARVGTGRRSMVFGFMLATAVLSAFVSNTATTAMMLPIALSVIELVGRMDREGESSPAFAEPLLLGIAYAATLGGMTTIIGTPPNAFLVGFVGETIAEPYRRSISFASWLMIGLPTALLLLPLTWWWLVRHLYRLDNTPHARGGEWIDRELGELGAMSRPERITLVVFLVTAVAWITRPWLVQWEISSGAAPWRPLAGLTDAGLAVGAATVLFIFPTGRPRETVLDWSTARGVPWDILLLFGGGLSLAKAVDSNGVAQFIAEHTTILEGAPSWVLVLLITTAVVFLTELTSNLATTAALLPVLAAMAPALGVHPYQLIIPATLGASCAFMMPIATPPNAIVFGSGRIPLRSMMRAGWWLNLFSIAWITLLSTIGLRWAILP